MTPAPADDFEPATRDAAVERVVTAKIYPGIGVARLGNSPDGYFLAPEVPGRFVDADGRFKDHTGRMKRQGARFRVYGLDADGQVVRELTCDDASVTWTAHVVNAKAAWNRFQHHESKTPRNADIMDTPEDPHARRHLVIDPGPRTISGPGQAGPKYAFDEGTFLGTPVPLGELRTDDAGRLIVLGGYGTSASSDGRDMVDFADNDRWHDDTSDGPITARVQLADGRDIPVTGTSWVIVAPPDFAPAVGNLVTLYDVQIEVASATGASQPPERVSFARDILPILTRIVGLRWVNEPGRRGHGAGSPGDFLSSANLARLGCADPTSRSARQRIFGRLRDPHRGDAAAVAQANLNFMPQLSGDGGFTQHDEPSTWLSLLPHQYDAMRRWADGDFDADLLPNDGPDVPLTLGALPVSEQPAALDRASLEACVGGPFFPGIEMTFICRQPDLYIEPHRFKPDLSPGDITKWMALPWQADFYDCRERWWPAQRPDDVISEFEYDAVVSALTGPTGTSTYPLARHLDLATTPWSRGVGDRAPSFGSAGYADMVRDWSRLGVVAPRTLPNGQVVLVEGEREKYFGLKDREYFHLILNIESHPDFLPTARALTDGYLSAARTLQTSDECPDVLRSFVYSTDVLRSRLEQIYYEDARAAHAFSISKPATEGGDPWTRELVIERLLQMAPYNQLDGAWLRHAASAGPIDDVHSLLFHVWMDELGDGDPKLSHANIYTDLLRSVGIHLEPIESRAYSENPELIDEAFTSPLFQLTISQFSEQYLPEILGMTLYLEWSVVPLKPQVERMRAFGLDPLFYSLHIGIDNAATGHGAMARRAVELYLAEARSVGGDAVMQEMWRRVWDGYVAFATTGDLGEYFRSQGAIPASPAQRLYTMMGEKEHFGAQNHGQKRLGDNLINDWFADPEQFARALVDSGYIIPGDVESSPFFGLLEYTGPMFRVFTDDEIDLWKEWTRSLVHEQPPSGPVPDVAHQMVDVVRTLQVRQQGNPGHDQYTMTGVPADATAVVTEPISWWFTQPPAVLLRALSNPANGWITPGAPDESRFLSELISGDRPMARAFGSVAPGTAHRTFRAIAIDWIAAGCPLTRDETVTNAQTLRAHPPLPGTIDGDEPLSGGLAARREDQSVADSVPRLLLFQPETWQPEYRHVRVFGNGALH